jgi:hypothetical protein
MPIYFLFMTMIYVPIIDAYIYVLIIVSLVSGVVLVSFIFVCFTFVLTDSC